MGPGFNLEAVRGRGGVGIISMQERAHSLGGDVRIQSQPGEGATVELEIPLPKVTEE
jgi:signal transduction histidine kinase